MKRFLGLRLEPNLFLALTSSVLLSFSLRPWNLGMLAFLAFIPLLIALHRETRAWKAGIYSYLVAMGGVFVAIDGLVTEFPMVFALGVLGYALGFFIPGYAVMHFKNRFGTRALLLFPVFWVATEFIISQRSLFGAYANPIMAIGYTQFGLPLLQTAHWSGVTGVSFLLVLVNTTIVYFILERRWLPLISSILLCAAAILVPAPSSKPAGSAFKVGIAQGYFPTAEYTLADFDQDVRTAIANRYDTLIANLETRGADLIVLPETALGGWQSELQNNREARYALKSASFALVGAKNAVGKDEGYNAILEWQRTANTLKQVYAKQIPIPFTEAGFTKGKSASVANLGGIPVGLGICWENVFPDLNRATVLKGARVMAYLNSLLWAGLAATPELQLHISAFRAVETGRDVIHATAGGPSAVLDHLGRIKERTYQATETFMLANVQPRTGATPYLILGDWLGVTCALSAGLLFILEVLRLRRRT